MCACELWNDYVDDDVENNGVDDDADADNDDVDKNDDDDKDDHCVGIEVCWRTESTRVRALRGRSIPLSPISDLPHSSQINPLLLFFVSVKNCMLLCIVSFRLFLRLLSFFISSLFFFILLVFFFLLLYDHTWSLFWIP